MYSRKKLPHGHVGSANCGHVSVSGGSMRKAVRRAETPRPSAGMSPGGAWKGTYLDAGIDENPGHSLPSWPGNPHGGKG